MRVSIRLFRKPLLTMLWLLALTAVCLLLSLGMGLCVSAAKTEASLEEQYTTIAVFRELFVKDEDSDAPLAGTRLNISQWHLDFLRDLPQVELIDQRGMLSAYSKSFQPCLSAQTEHAYEQEFDEPYNRVLFVVKVLENNYGEPIPLSGVDLSLYTYHGIAQIEETLLADDSYKLPDEVELYWASNDPLPELEVGEQYLLYGTYYAADLKPTLSGMQEQIPSIAVSNNIPPELSTLGEDGQLHPVDTSALATPTMAKLTMSPEEFLALEENELWRQAVQGWQITAHSVPLLGTESLESLYLFHQKKASIVEGRGFTQAEYDTGERVCVISEALARNSGIRVGDSIKLSQYTYPVVEDLDLSENNPCAFPYFPEHGFATQDETFTIVGIYRQENWWDNGNYSLTPNAVFTPAKALAEGAVFPNKGVYLSVQLKNGQVNGFLDALAGTDLEGKLLCSDQGYVTARDGVRGLQSAALRLLLLIIALFLLLYQSKEQRTLGIMRSLGASRETVRRYFFLSAAALALAAVVLGNVLSGALSSWVTERVYGGSYAGAQTGAFSAKGVSQSFEALLALVRENKIGPWGIVLCGLAQAVVIGLLLWIQADRLASRNPRRLLNVKGG